MAKITEENERLRRLFVLFYVMKELWKHYGRDITDLYQAIFPTEIGNGNRTLYTRILSLDEYVDITLMADKLSNTTGLPTSYFYGDQALNVGFPDEWNVWQKFEQMRKECRNKQDGARSFKSDELKLLERQIKVNIRGAATKAETAGHINPFSILVHFAKYGQKRSEVTVNQLIEEVDRAIANATYLKMREATEEQLTAHLNRVTEYARRLSALINISQWKT